MTIKEMTDKMITIELARANGNRQEAAKMLGIPKKKIYRLIKERTAKDGQVTADAY